MLTRGEIGLAEVRESDVLLEREPELSLAYVMRSRAVPVG